MDGHMEQPHDDGNGHPFISLPRESRTPRAARLPATFNDHNTGQAAMELTSIMASVSVASNPVSPGPSSPPIEQTRHQEFIPPTRPSSTPFPQPENRAEDVRYPSCPVDADDKAQKEHGDAVERRDRDASAKAPLEEDGMDLDYASSDDVPANAATSMYPSPPFSGNSFAGPMSDLETAVPNIESPTGQSQRFYLPRLPIEIQETILNYVFDCRVAPITKASPDKKLTRLACISPVWRDLIQERLYCHIKLKATGMTLTNAHIHFEQHPHLRAYVKHAEFWFPVFQPVARLPPTTSSPLFPLAAHEPVTTNSYTLPSDNCSLEEVFYFASSTFPELCILTLEGGERKKAPQVRHFIRSSGGSCNNFESSAGIPQITTVRTLVCKGQWNIIRSEEDFHNIAFALPNLQQWQASYSKPKSKSYLTMATILPQLPINLTSLDLCLESDYRQEISFPPYFLKVTNQVDFCSRLAEATPSLQHLAYTGRVCRTFFDIAARLADPRTTRLKSVDLTVKNCCRHVSYWHESGSGTTDLNFIRAFEALVLSAVRSMGRLTKLEHLRIRYVDLEFPVPPLNPFFLLHDNWASGVWSDLIVSELARVRPDVCWEELSDTFGDVTLGKDGQMFFSPEFPKKRVASLKLANYAFLAALATM